MDIFLFFLRLAMPTGQHRFTLHKRLVKILCFLDTKQHRIIN